MAKSFITWVLKTTLTWGCLIGGLFAIYQFAALPYLNQLSLRDSAPKIRAYRVPLPPGSKWYTAKATFEKSEPPIIKSSQKGTIKKIMVKPGDMVEAGDALLHLDTAAYLERLQDLQGILQDENLTTHPEVPVNPDEPEDVNDIKVTNTAPTAGSKQEPNSKPGEKLPPVNLTQQQTSKPAPVKATTTQSSKRLEIPEEDTSIEESLEPVNPLKKEIGFLRWLIDDATLQSPVAGKIKSLLVEPGNTIEKDTPIVELETQSNPTFQLSLDPQIGSQLHIGQQVYVSFTDSRGQKHQIIATVQYFDEASTLTTASIIIQARASDADAVSTLNADDTVDVSFQIIDPDDIEVPCSTLYPKSDSYWVMQLVKKDALYQLLPTPVVVEPLSATKCQIISGLVPGNLIVYPEINRPLPSANTLVNVTYDSTLE